MGFLDERPNHPPTVVVTTGVLPAPRWRLVAPVVITGLLLAPIVFAVTFLFANRIEPVHRQLGQSFAIAGVTYRVLRVRTKNSEVAVTMTATSPTQLDSCTGIAGFELDDAGQTYHEPMGGCFSPPSDLPSMTILPQRDLIQLPMIQHQAALMALMKPPEVPNVPELFNNDRIGILESDAEASPQLDHVRDVWWRPATTLIWRERWTDTYPATVNGPMSLVVRAAGGVHQFGYDRYAVVHLR